MSKIQKRPKRRFYQNKTLCLTIGVACALNLGALLYFNNTALQKYLPEEGSLSWGSIGKFSTKWFSNSKSLTEEERSRQRQIEQLLEEVQPEKNQAQKLSVRQRADLKKALESEDQLHMVSLPPSSEVNWEQLILKDISVGKLGDIKKEFRESLPAKQVLNYSLKTPSLTTQAPETSSLKWRQSLALKPKGLESEDDLLTQEKRWQKIEQLSRELERLHSEREIRNERTPLYVATLREKNPIEENYQWGETPFFKVGWRTLANDDTPLVELLLEPRAKMSRQAQDIIFLIDRSKYVDVEMFEATKKAVKELVTHVDPRDRVRVAFYDRSLSGVTSFLSEQNPIQSNEMEEVKRGGIFSQSDLVRSILAYEEERDPSRLTTYIAVTQGSQPMSSKVMRKQLAHFSSQSLEDIALYTLVLESSRDGRRESQVDLLSLLIGGVWTQAHHPSEVYPRLKVLFDSSSEPHSRRQSVSLSELSSGTEIYNSSKDQALGAFYDPSIKRILFPMPKESQIKLFIQWVGEDAWYDTDRELLLSPGAAQDEKGVRDWKIKTHLTEMMKALLLEDSEKVQLAQHELTQLQYPLPL